MIDYKHTCKHNIVEEPTQDASEFLDYREDRPCYNEIFCECRDCDECSFRNTD